MFRVKVTAKAYILFLLYLLNCWLVCDQTWFDSTLSWAGVSYGKMGLLHFRSRSQQRFRMSANVWMDDIFWFAEHFVTKPASRARGSCRFFVVAIFKVKVTASAHSYDQNLTLSTIFSEYWFLGYQFWSDDTSQYQVWKQNVWWFRRYHLDKY